VKDTRDQIQQAPEDDGEIAFKILDHRGFGFAICFGQGQCPDRQTTLRQIGLIDKAVDPVQHQGHMQVVNMLVCVRIQCPVADRSASCSHAQDVDIQAGNFASCHNKAHEHFGSDRQIFCIAGKT